MVRVVIAVLAFVPAMHGQNSGDLRELMQTLGKAYQNSVMQDAPNADLQTDDLRLETSSIMFSLLMLDEIGKGVCQSSDPATPGVVDQACVLDDEFAGLNNLSESLSYAASRLEKISEAVPRADLSKRDLTDPVLTNPDLTKAEQSLFVARIQSMEHLYRMVFALSGVYLDANQSAVYLQAADEQLQLAHSSMENERALCACDPSGYATRLDGLSKLSNRITSLRAASLP